MKRTIKVGKVSRCEEGRPALSFWPDCERMSLEKIAAGLPNSYWKSLATRAGERGPVRYQWASVRVIVPDEGERWLLIRKPLHKHDDLAFYFSNAYESTPLLELAEVALRRFAIEQCFAEAKTEAGLDEYEVRLWSAWYRHITLAMIAHAFLVTTKKTVVSGTPNDSPNCSRPCKASSGNTRRVFKNGFFSGLAQVQTPKKDSSKEKSLPGKILQAGSK